MGFLQTFFQKKSTNVTAQQLCEYIRPQLGTPYSDSISTSKYRSWIYVAANHNARNVADSEIKLFSNIKPKASKSKPITKKTFKNIQSYGLKAYKETQEIEDHPIIDLLHSPNSEDSFYSFIYKIDLFLELTGDAYILIERTGNGIPIALYVLYSQYITIQTDGSNQVIAYNYGIPRNGKFDYTYLPDDIIHIKFFDPNNIHYGISPLEACARSYGLIESMTTYEEALNRNLGVPSGLLKYKNESIKAADRELIENKWQSKFASVGRAGKIVVTDQDVEYEVIGVTPREIQFLDGRKYSRDEILACYGICPALLLTDDVNRSNMTQASINYYHNTLKPRCRLISQTLTNELVKKNGIDGKNMFLMIEKDAPEDEEMEIKKVELLSKNKAITVNEMRSRLGYDLLDDVIGDQLVLNRESSQKENENG